MGSRSNVFAWRGSEVIRDFGIRSRRVFTRYHSLQEELDWLDSEGPVSPDLLARLQRSAGEFDFVVLFSVRYHQAYYGARAIPGRAVLVPTAEREPALALAIFQPIFRGVRAIMYNSLEERAAIQGLAHNEDVPGVVVGVGSMIPAATDPQRARQAFGLSRPFVLYVGRIEENKGCAELFDYFQRYLESSRRDLDLVLIGTPAMPIPSHPRIRHLGFVSDQDKFDATRRRRCARDAVVFREPVDGRARSVGARPAGARQREMRRAAGTVHPQQRRPVL